METNIRSLRQAKGMKLRRLAALAGLNPGRLSYIERGIMHPDEDEVHRLSEILGSPIHLYHTVEPRRIEKARKP